MADFRRVPSSLFRVTYVTEQEPVTVTALGRPIGHYIPVGAANINVLIAALRDPASRPGQETEAAGDPAPGDPDRPEASDDRGEDFGLPARATGLATSPAASTPAPPSSTSPSGAQAFRAETSRSRSPLASGGSVAGMTQAEKDKVLRKVAKGG